MSPQEPALLTKVFSREKPLMYFCLWEDSDRLGYQDFLQYDLGPMVLIVPSAGEKGSVWYVKDRWAEAERLLKKRVLEAGDELTALVLERMNTHFSDVLPYLTGEKSIASPEDFQIYYDHLVRFWSGMTIAFYIPDSPGVSEQAKESILAFRSVSEKYTEEMSKRMKAFWTARFPQHEQVGNFVTIPEAIRLAEHSDSALLEELAKRKNGCFMLERNARPLAELDAALSEHGLMFESIIAEEASELRGTIAFKGIARGSVKIIRSFVDMQHFRPGEVLVTEMTNPDYVPIMKIAAAVITDEGGMTCHAAIASREMKVPCIVGTRVATKVFKDGDTVEVDAENGIVRKI